MKWKKLVWVPVPEIQPGHTEVVTWSPREVTELLWVRLAVRRETPLSELWFRDLVIDTMEVNGCYQVLQNLPVRMLDKVLDDPTWTYGLLKPGYPVTLRIRAPENQMEAAPPMDLLIAHRASLPGFQECPV